MPAVAALASPGSPAPSVPPSPTPHRNSGSTLQPNPTATASPTASASPTPLPSPSPTPFGTPVSGEPLPLSLGWRLDANGHLSDVAVNGPCEGDETSGSNGPAFFLASLGRTVYALDRQGKVEWQARLPGPIYALTLAGGGDQPGSVAVAGDNGVTLLSMQGRRLWYRDLGTRVTALESDSSCGGQSALNGGLLAGGWDQQITRLDSRGGLVWQANLGAPVSDILWLAKEKLAVAATLDGNVHAFDQSGKEVWQLVVEPGVPITRLAPLPHDDGSALLVGLQSGRLVALDTGADLNSAARRQEFDGEPQVRWQQAMGEGGPVWHTADVNGDGAPEIVVGTGGDTPQLVLLSTAGELGWRVALPSPVNAVTTLRVGDSTAILAGLASGEIQAYDDQGRLRAAVQAGLSVWYLAADGSDALALADVVAWQIVPSAGPAGSAWLGAPALASLPDAADLAAEDSAARPEGTAVLVFLGDVVPGRSMEAQLARYGPAYPWGGLELLLGQADLAVANLESVLTTQGQPLNKPYIIRAHPGSGQTLVEAGLDLVSLANNHALDYGQVGLDETLDTLDALEIAVVGAGCETSTTRTADLCRAGQPAIFTLNGVKVAVLGYAGAYWNGSPDMPASDKIAWAEPARVQADVQAVRAEADIVIVLLHAGIEYAAKPSSSQVAAAHAAIDAGADLVVGHHPHVTQTVERYGPQGRAEGSSRDGLIVYSLGNAVFDIPRQAAMQGDLLRVYVTRDGLQRAELWPFWIEDAIRPRLLADDHGNPRFSILYDR